MGELQGCEEEPSREHLLVAHPAVDELVVGDDELAAHGDEVVRPQVERHALLGVLELALDHLDVAPEPTRRDASSASANSSSSVGTSWYGAVYPRWR